MRLQALACTLLLCPAPTAAEPTDRVADMIIAVSTSKGWTPDFFKRERGRTRAKLYATIITEEAAAAGLVGQEREIVAWIHKESSFINGAIGRVGEVGWPQVFGSDWRSRNGQRARFACDEPAAVLLRAPRLALRCGLREVVHWRGACTGNDPADLYAFAAFKMGGCADAVARHGAKSVKARAGYIRGLRRRLANLALPSAAR